MPNPELERMFEARPADERDDGYPKDGVPATVWICRKCGRGWIIEGGLDVGSMNSLLAHGRSHEEKPKMQRLGARK